MKVDKSYVEDQFEAILDLCYVFDAIYTILCNSEPGPGTYHHRTLEYLDSKFLELYDLLEELWEEYGYLTIFEVIDAPDKLGLLHTANINDVTDWEMKEFIITINPPENEMVITVAQKDELITETILPMTMDQINPFSKLINKIYN